MGRRSGRGSVSARESREARPEVAPSAGPDQPTAAQSGRAAAWLRTRGFLFAIFAASGFAGLIYESIWTHYLKLFLGHAAYAQTLVLAIFMGGMALGSWISSRKSPRWRNLFAAYAITEAVVGVLGLVFHEIFTAATGLAYDVLLPRLAGSAAAVSALKWGLSAALILPQSVLLGMTFPLMTAGVLRAFPDRPGRSLAMLYFTNSLGAAVGVLVSGFVLVSALGLPGTVRTAGLIDMVVAALVLPLARRTAQPPPLAVAQSERRVDGVLLWFLGVALITGASSFIYEVTWIRMLSLVLGASTHAFELMLSAFILGLALGGLWIQRRIDELRSPVRVLGYLQVAMGIAALLTLLAYGGTFHAMRWLILNLARNDLGYGLFNLASNGLALAIMLPATFCAGTTLPLITFHLIRRGCGEMSVGAVYAANTVGAIVGVFFAVHLGLPWLGLKGLLTVGGGLDIALGAALLWSAGAALTRRRVPVALTALGAVAIALTGSLVRLDPRKTASGVYRLGVLVPESEEVFFQRDRPSGQVDAQHSHERQTGRGARDVAGSPRDGGRVDDGLDECDPHGPPPRGPHGRLHRLRLGVEHARPARESSSLARGYDRDRAGDGRGRPALSSPERARLYRPPLARRDRRREDLLLGAASRVRHHRL